MMGRRAMAEVDGPGVRAHRAKNRRLMTIFLVETVAMAGVMVWLMTSAHRSPAGRLIPAPEAAATAALVYPLIGLVAMIVFLRAFDEHARRMVIMAFSVGFLASAYCLFAWSFLWWGELAPMPNAYAVFGVGFVAMLVAIGWVELRLRRS